MLERIQASLHTLAPAEQRVAQLLLNDPRTFANLPVAELAQRAEVSKPTVVRFCRSMGYEGLSDFKRKLLGSLSEGVPFIHRNVGASDDASQVLVKVIDNTVAAFLKYRNDASSAMVEKAAQAIVATLKKGKRLEFFGVGNSGIVAQDAQHKFFRLGMSVVAYSDGHMQVMSASMLSKGDCVVVISNSGRTRDLMDACDIARKRGMNVDAARLSAELGCPVVETVAVQSGGEREQADEQSGQHAHLRPDQQVFSEFDRSCGAAVHDRHFGAVDLDQRVVDAAAGPDQPPATGTPAPTDPAAAQFAQALSLIEAGQPDAAHIEIV